MHKRFVNHCTLEISIIPNSPILIKSGREGADPTKPQMEFVETYYNGKPTIYLPGSSLKGAIRAHAERIVKTVGYESEQTDLNKIWASDPLNLTKAYDIIQDPITKKKLAPADIYKKSSFTDQIFGSIGIASRFRVEDAYPDESEQGKFLRKEERNGVAIDRVTGSATNRGLFDYQVCTNGAFKTKIHLKNFSLAQLGLLVLVLRDLDEGWFGIGFAKSRGLGRVQVHYNSAIVSYPGCKLDKDEKIKIFGHKTSYDKVYLLGAGEFVGEQNPYNFPFPDQQEIVGIKAKPMKHNFGVQFCWEEKDGNVGIDELFDKAVAAWSDLLEQGGSICASLG